MSAAAMPTTKRRNLYGCVLRGLGGGELAFWSALSAAALPASVISKSPPKVEPDVVHRTIARSRVIPHDAHCWLLGGDS